MKVHITSTPEILVESLDDVLSLLQSIPGELVFAKEIPLSIPQFSFFNEKFNHITEIEDFTFDELFNLVHGYRRLKDIPDDEFVILLTNIKNFKNWFSAFNGKNIFVHCGDWEKFSTADPKYGIAY